MSYMAHGLDAGMPSVLQLNSFTDSMAYVQWQSKTFALIEDIRSFRGCVLRLLRAVTDVMISPGRCCLRWHLEYGVGGALAGSYSTAEETTQLGESRCLPKAIRDTPSAASASLVNQA